MCLSMEKELDDLSVVYGRPYDYPPLKGKNTEQETEYSSLIPRPAHVISSLQKEENDTCFSYFKDQQTLGGSNKIMHMEIFAKMGKSTPGFPSSIQLQGIPTQCLPDRLPGDQILSLEAHSVSTLLEIGASIPQIVTAF
ncbi:ATP-binding cassette sub-family A member 13 [Manis javanica]|nr:ATP-binding cassette sub-family A member 13 [Manis javanica]